MKNLKEDIVSLHTKNVGYLAWELSVKEARDQARAQVYLNVREQVLIRVSDRIREQVLLN